MAILSEVVPQDGMEPVQLDEVDEFNEDIIFDAECEFTPCVYIAANRQLSIDGDEVINQ